MPSSKNYVRNYGPSGEGKYTSQPKVKKRNALRSKARRAATKAGKVHKFDGKDVDHKKPLVKGGSGAKSNLRVLSASKNRSFKRTKKAGMK